jgi:signal peptidase I
MRLCGKIRGIDFSGVSVRSVFEFVSETFLFPFIVLLFILTLVIRVNAVEGSSMLPTLNDGDKVLTTNFFYTPKNGDIVVVYAENVYNDKKEVMGQNIIKRVIGVAGDVIEFDTDEGVVYRNGDLLGIDEADGVLYEDGYSVNSRTYSRKSLPASVTVPAGYILVLGDNRGGSSDSRDSHIGLIDVNLIVGKAIFRVLPLSDFGFVE